jgi:hypothetical protein
MTRKRELSFLKRLSNPFTNWSYPRTPTTMTPPPRREDLDCRVKDEVFLHHLDGPDFERLDEQSLLVAQIVHGRKPAKRLLDACHWLGMIDPDSGRPSTHRIDRSMIKEMPAVSADKQRDLVMLLFFWEDEITRWRMLSREERDLKQQLTEEMVSEESKKSLRHSLLLVQARKRVLPSLREDSGRGLDMIDDKDDELPTYAQFKTMAS